MSSTARFSRTLIRQFEYLTTSLEQKKILTAVMKRAKSQATLPDGASRILFDEYELRVARPVPASSLVAVPEGLRSLLKQSARLTWRSKDQPTCLIDHAELCVEEESSAELVTENGMEDIFDGQPVAYKVVCQGPDCWFLHPTLPGIIFWDHASNRCSPFDATAGWVFLRIMAQSLELANVPDLSPLLPSAMTAQLPPVQTADSSLSDAAFLAFGYPDVTLPRNGTEPNRKLFNKIMLVESDAKLAVLVDEPIEGETHKKAHLIVWDPRTGTPINRGRVNVDERRVFFSRDMRLVAYCAHNRVEIWTWGQNAERLCIIKHGCVEQAQFSEDGRTVFTHGHGTYVGVWNSETGQTLVSKRRKPESSSGSDISAIDFERNILVLAIQGNHVPAVYTVGSTKPDITLIAHDSELRSVALSPDTKLVASGDTDGLVLVSDRATGAVLGRYRQPGLYAKNLAFSPDNRWLLAMSTCASSDIKTRMVLWDLGTGASPIREECYSCPAIWLPDGKSFVITDYWANLRSFQVPEKF